MSDVPTQEQVEHAIHVIGGNADRLEQIAINLKRLRDKVTPPGTIAVTDTDKLTLGGYAMQPLNGHNQVKLTRGEDDIDVVINTEPNQLRLVREAHQLTDHDIQLANDTLNEVGALAHKMHLDYNIHNENPPLSFRRYYDRPEKPRNEQGMLEHLGEAAAIALAVMNNAQQFTGESPVGPAEREQARRDAEFLAQCQQELAEAGHLLARYNAITDLEGERKRELYTRVKDHAHRPQAEAVYKASKFEQGVQLLGESQQKAADDLSFQERISKRKPLKILDEDDLPPPEGKGR